MPVVDAVEVHLQDLGLRVVALQLQRQDQLLDLAAEGPLGNLEERGLDHLLGDGAGSLRRLAMGEVVQGRTDDPHRIHPAVGVEVPIFHRDRGVLEIARDVPQVHHRPVLEVVLGEQRGAVAGIDAGDLGERPRAEAFDGRQVLGVVGVHGAGGQHRHRAGEQHGGQDRPSPSDSPLQAENGQQVLEPVGRALEKLPAEAPGGAGKVSPHACSRLRLLSHRLHSASADVGHLVNLTSR